MTKWAYISAYLCNQLVKRVAWACLPKIGFYLNRVSLICLLRLPFPLVLAGLLLERRVRLPIHPLPHA